MRNRLWNYGTSMIKIKFRDYTAKPAFLSTEFLRKIQKFSQLEKNTRCCASLPAENHFLFFSISYFSTSSYSFLFWLYI